MKMYMIQIINDMKAFTDIEQSKKLAEILPIESADMRWYYKYNDGDKPQLDICNGSRYYIPCWSVTALLDFLKPDIYLEHEDGVGWKVSEYVVIEKPNSILSDIKYVQGFSEDNPVDACVEMILKLNEQKLL